ncbi:hypothetical protein BJ742DRAFT_773658 [Cladochytrium replicatum]|nr:hypothetical protein BJ742DRAFT_773658 [Cladochytrium replicatum]
MGNQLSTRFRKHPNSRKAPSESPSFPSPTRPSFSPDDSGHRADPLLRYSNPLIANEVTTGSQLQVSQHYILKKVFQTNFMGISADALASGIKVLDAAASSGTWLAEMQRDFPASQYFGLDLGFGVWPDAQLVRGAKRTTIVDCDALTTIPFEDNTFDYVHEQANLYVTQEAELPQAFRELTRILKPGGYIDIIETNPIPPNASRGIVADFIGRLYAQMCSGGVNLSVATGCYTDIQVIRRNIPIGWDGDLGKHCREHMTLSQMTLMHVFAPSVNPPGQPLPTEEGYRKFVEEYFDACAENQVYIQAFRVTARKKSLAV